MQTQFSDENSVCPSICPSVKRVHCDKTEERTPRGAQKRKTAVFRLKSHFAWRNSSTEIFLLWKLPATKL